MRHKYVKSAIIEAWRDHRDQRGYATLLAKRFRVPPAVIHNVVHQHRKKTRMRNIEYRTKAILENPIPVMPENRITRPVKRLGKRILKNIFQSQVVFVSASNFN